MRWRVRKLNPNDRYDRASMIDGDSRLWLSYPIGEPNSLRRHRTHPEALERAIVKAYGPQRKATP